MEDYIPDDTVDEQIVSVGQNHPVNYKDHAEKQFLRDQEFVVIRARGQSIAKAFTVEQMLKRELREQDDMELETELLHTGTHKKEGEDGDTLRISEVAIKVGVAE